MSFFIPSTNTQTCPYHPLQYQPVCRIIQDILVNGKVMTAPIQQIRKATVLEEIDYNLVTSYLQDYASPRDIITRMLNAGELIRVKKGIYVFGKLYANHPFSLEILANMIYGPSYISREYALSFYGIIPEAVHEIMSMCCTRNKIFETPVGRFSYRYLNKDRYAIGVQRIEIRDGVYANIATPEKALADMIYSRNENILDEAELSLTLTEDYRIDNSEIAKLRVTAMEKIADRYNNPTISLLPIVIRGAKSSE